MYVLFFFYLDLKPSTLMASMLASLRILTADRTACCSLSSYDPNGMSARSRGRLAPRDTACTDYNGISKHIHKAEDESGERGTLCACFPRQIIARTNDGIIRRVGEGGKDEGKKRTQPQHSLTTMTLVSMPIMIIIIIIISAIPSIRLVTWQCEIIISSEIGSVVSCP